MIKIDNLSKAYRDNLVFEGVNMDILPGVVYGVIGKNGAGKTTFFHCISGMESYDGEIAIEPIASAKRIGYLPTVPELLSKITGEEYLRLFCNARNINYDQLSLPNIFELPLSGYATNYSTGMKKNLAITALLLQKNEIFIFDEPFNGLDLESNIMVNKIILKLKSMNKIVLVSSHILSGLLDISDEIIYIKNRSVKAYKDSSDINLLKQDMIDTDIDDKLAHLNL